MTLLDLTLAIALTALAMATIACIRTSWNRRTIERLWSKMQP